MAAITVRVDWIVGAGCGVGRAWARKLSMAGALIVLRARNVVPLEQAKRDLLAAAE
jgi:NADP-dependent 3-hydroxy acid dehydrogenase YdfG